MTQGNLKTAMAGLLVATGIFHLIVAFTGDVGDLTLGLALFGVAYFLAGVFLFPGKKVAVQVAMVLTFLGLGLGGVNYLQHGGPPGLVVMFVIDVAVLALGGLWLAKNKPAA
jgi:hypothetical protein